MIFREAGEKAGASAQKPDRKPDQKSGKSGFDAAIRLRLHCGIYGISAFQFKRDFKREHSESVKRWEF